MKARERVLNAIRGLPVDRPVAAPYMGNFAIRTAGSSLSDCYLDPIKMAEAQLKAWEMLGQDVIVVQSDNYYMAEAFGAPVLHAEDSLPVLKDTTIKHPKDVYALKAVDPASEGRMPVYIEAIARISRQVGGSAAVRGCGTGPFVLAGHLCGIEPLLMWMMDTEIGEADYTRELDHLFSLGLDTLVKFVSAQLEAGATIVQLADSLASLDMISPAMYRKYVFPYETEFYARIQHLVKEHDAAALLHICGNNTVVFDEYARTGADVIAIDHAAELADAKKVIGDRACLIGNLDPSGSLLFGTPEEVYADAVKALDTCLPGRFILGTGCEVSIKTPVENIQAMLRAAMEYRIQAGV